MNYLKAILGGVLGAGMAAVMTVAAAAQPERPSTRTVRPAVPAVEPVVVELFTAQGCPGCPEANRVVETLSGEPGVIALTYSVDYWDYLGWPDTFARPEFAERQNAYRSAMRLRNVYTPQVIINGHLQVPGGVAPVVQEAMNAAAADAGSPPQIEFRASGNRVGVGSGRAPQGGADVWAVTFTRGPQTVTVNGGDNRGQAVRHVNVVSGLKKMGAWSGRPALYTLPSRAEPGEGVVVLVQSRTDGRILSAAAL